MTWPKGPGYTSAPMAGSSGDGAWAGMGIGWAVVSTLIGGIAVWGGLGYLADRLLGLNPRILTAVGIVLGAGAAIYLVYLRFGKGEGNRRGA
jgi:ATP synthase protein I